VYQGTYFADRKGRRKKPCKLLNKFLMPSWSDDPAAVKQRQAYRGGVRRRAHHGQLAAMPPKRKPRNASGGVLRLREAPSSPDKKRLAAREASLEAYARPHRDRAMPPGKSANN